MRRKLTLPVLLSTLVFAACGTTGPLTLPPPSKAPALPAGKTIQPTIQPAPNNLNTAKEAVQ